MSRVLEAPEAAWTRGKRPAAASGARSSTDSCASLRYIRTEHAEKKKSLITHRGLKDNAPPFAAGRWALLGGSGLYQSRNMAPMSRLWDFGVSVCPGDVAQELAVLCAQAPTPQVASGSLGGYETPEPSENIDATCLARIEDPIDGDACVPVDERDRGRRERRLEVFGCSHRKHRGKPPKCATCQAAGLCACFEIDTTTHSRPCPLARESRLPHRSAPNRRAMPSQTWGLHPAVQLIPPAIAARESCCPSNQQVSSSMLCGPGADRPFVCARFRVTFEYRTHRDSKCRDSLRAHGPAMCPRTTSDAAANRAPLESTDYVFAHTRLSI